VNLGDFFSPGELAAWSDQRLTCHLLYFTAVGIKLLFLVGVTCSSLREAIARFATTTANWLYARRTLAFTGKALPPLRGVVGIIERLGSGGKAVDLPKTQWLVDIFYPVYLLMLWALLVLPLSFFSDYIYEHELGLSTTTLSRWWSDWAIGLVLTLSCAALLGLGLFGLARRLRRTWWLWLWGAVVGALFLWSMLTPYRARIYHDFQELPDGPLRQSIGQVMQKAGFELERVNVVDTSKRSRRANAFIMGAGPTRRVVLSDNLVEAFHPREIQVAIAHEAGHEINKHPLRTWLTTSIAALLFLLICRLILWSAPKSRRLKLSPHADPKTLPLIFLAANLLFLINNPISAHLDRQEEQKADQEALKLTEDPTAYCSLLIRLTRINQHDPDPKAWARWYFRHHPTTKERLEFGFKWAESQGTPIDKHAIPLPAPSGHKIEMRHFMDGS
jgi:STE24 endopeptidase